MRMEGCIHRFKLCLQGLYAVGGGVQGATHSGRTCGGCNRRTSERRPCKLDLPPDETPCVDGSGINPTRRLNFVILSCVINLEQNLPSLLSPAKETTRQP